MSAAIGLIESISVARGYEMADAMVKRAAVTLLACRPICPGKHLTMIAGDVGAVEASVSHGLAVGGTAVVDYFLLPNAHDSIVPALSGTVACESLDGVVSLGVIETFSVASLIVAADTAVKAARVQLVEIRAATGVGGKSFCTMVGEVSAVRSAVDAGAGTAARNGLLISKIVIPAASPEVLRHLM
ncbi:MAG: BMC domain-containing protein [Ignavibacteriales bacterium]